MMLNSYKTNTYLHRSLKRAVILPFILVGMSESIAAASEDTAQQNSDVSHSIEKILQRASEQGFVDLKTPEDKQETNQEIEIEAPEILIEQLSAEMTGKTECQIADLLDLKSYQSVISYTDIGTTKSKLKSLDSLEDRIPLIKTYWSLGLGTEAVALVHPFNDQRTPLLTAVGKVLSGEASASSISVFKQFARCNANADLWLKVAIADAPTQSTSGYNPTITESDLSTLENLPEKLRDLLTLRLGILAVETGEIQLAQKMLNAIEPSVKKGKLPHNRDDETMYLFALLDVSDQGIRGRKILEKLSKYDGPIRSKAILRVSEQLSKDGSQPYQGFSDDLQSISQQYNGKEESQLASIQSIKHLLESGATTESMTLTMRALDIEDPKRIEVINLIASHILVGLKNDENHQRLSALNAYLFDSGFFKPLKTLSELKHAALVAALALNIPELETQIYADEEMEMLGNTERKLLALAKVKSADKSGSIEKLKEVMAPFSDDIEFQSILIRALVDAGRPGEALEIIDAFPNGPEKFTKQADIEWRSGDFKAAYSTLQSLDYASAGKLDSRKLEFSRILTSGETAYSNMLVPNTASGLDEFQSDISNDIDIVKAFLTHG